MFLSNIILLIFYIYVYSAGSNKLLRYIMCCLCPTRIIALFSPLFGSAIEPISANLNSKEPIIYMGETMNVIVPKCPLATGSLEIVPNTNTRNFTEWNDFDGFETYKFLQHIIRIWEKEGITDYLIYGKESNSKSIYSWEIVPYPKRGWRILKQFKVLWNITFGGTCLSKAERYKVAQDIQKNTDAFSEYHKQIESIKKIAQESDAFCNQKVIEKQLVYEGKEIYVLYDYAPLVLSNDKLHFLIVPKEHRSKFSDLSRTEYLESMQLSQKLIKFYKEKGYNTAYIFDKNGVESGQTVPHWHEHIVFTATKTQDFIGKLTVLKNMFIGSSPLPQKELQTKVQLLRKELNEALSVNILNP